MVNYAFGFVPFQGNNTAGSQTITDPDGPGLVPKGAIFFLSGTSADEPSPTLTNAGRASLGMTDGTNQRSIGMGLEEATATATADMSYRIDTATVLQMPAQGSELLEVEAAFSSFGTDQVTITWSAATQLRGWVILLYGSQLQCHVGSGAGSGTIGGTASFTDFGRKPSLLVVGSCNQTFVADGAGNGTMLSVGFATRLPTIKNACAVLCAEDRALTATSSGLLMRDDVCAAQLTSLVGTVTYGAGLEVTSFDATGHTFTTRNANAALEAMFMSVDIGDAPCWCGIETIAAGTTGNKDVTSPGFLPLFAMIAAARLGTVNSVSSAQGNMSLAAADADLDQAAGGFSSRDNLATSDAFSTYDSAGAVLLPQTQTTYDWRADLTSWLTNGFRLNVTSAAGGDRLICALAVGRRAQNPELARRPGYWRRSLARM